MNDLIDTKEAAKLTGYTVNTLNFYRNAKRGPSYLKGTNNKVFYDRKTVLDWMAKQGYTEVKV